MTNLDAALTYASRGWHVFQTLQGKKVPDHAEGLYAATTSPDLIREWWDEYPLNGVAVSTGPSGLLVIDVDPDAGMVTPAEVRATFDLPETFTVRTPRGGFHLYYAQDGELGNTAGKLHVGVDTRGQGGYVVAPPTSFRNGAYAVLDDREPAPLPASMAEHLARVPASSDVSERREARVTSAYGAAALERECARVASAEEGSRNDTLNRATFAIGRLVGGGEVTRTDAVNAFVDAARDAGLDDFEASPENIERILADGEAHPRSAPRVEQDDAPIRMDGVGNARRFAIDYAGQVAYAKDSKAWWVYRDGRWVRDESAVRALAQGPFIESLYQRAEDLREQAADTVDDDARDAILERAKSWENWARKSSYETDRVVHLAKAEPGLVTMEEDFDADAYALNTPDGVVDLRTGSMREHRPEDYTTKMTAAAPGVVDGPAHGLWQEFLDLVMPEPEEQDALQRLLGYSTIGNVSEKVMVFVKGPANTGKSKVLDAVNLALGSYGMTASVETFLQVGGRENYHLADLAGRRFIVTTEFDEDQRVNRSFVKAFTGGDPVTVRRIHESPFTYQPAGTIFVGTNRMPWFGGDPASWTRVILVPFELGFGYDWLDHRMGDGTRVNFADAWRQAAPEVLLWLLDGVRKFREGGIVVPERWAIAAEAERSEQRHHYFEFIDERLAFEADAWVASGDLEDAYTAWLDANPEVDWDDRATPHARGRMNREAGMDRRSKPGGGPRGWAGARLKTAEELA